MSELLTRHAMALNEFGRRVRQIRLRQWHDPTPCTRWNVRTLVNHLVAEQLWVPHTLAGQTVDDVGDRYDGDLLGDEPVEVWERAAEAAHRAFAEGGALEGTVHLSYGDSRADAYCEEMIDDLVVHAWDLARGIGADERLDPELVDRTYQRVVDRADALQQTGLFAAPVETPPDADRQSLMLAILGRRV